MDSICVIDGLVAKEAEESSKVAAAVFRSTFPDNIAVVATRDAQHRQRVRSRLACALSLQTSVGTPADVAAYIEQARYIHM